MALSRRLRFEILRRDGHTCRYCGARAPEVALTVDHVKPTALGGTDVPENLVTACADCNSGKASVPAGAPLVADVEQDALRWAKAIQQAAYYASIDFAVLAEDVSSFDRLWSGWKTQAGQGDVLPRPAAWPDSVERFLELGLTVEIMGHFVGVAMRKDSLSPEDVWSYFCGCCWRQIDRLQEEARSMLRTENTGGAVPRSTSDGGDA